MNSLLNNANDSFVIVMVSIFGAVLAGNGLSSRSRSVWNGSGTGLERVWNVPDPFQTTFGRHPFAIRKKVISKTNFIGEKAKPTPKFKIAICEPRAKTRLFQRAEPKASAC